MTTKAKLSVLALAAGIFTAMLTGATRAQYYWGHHYCGFRYCNAKLMSRPHVQTGDSVHPAATTKVAPRAHRP